MRCKQIRFEVCVKRCLLVTLQNQINKNNKLALVYVCDSVPNYKKVGNIMLWRFIKYHFLQFHTSTSVLILQQIMFLVKCFLQIITNLKTCGGIFALSKTNQHYSSSTLKFNLNIPSSTLVDTNTKGILKIKRKN